MNKHGWQDLKKKQKKSEEIKRIQRKEWKKKKNSW